MKNHTHEWKLVYSVFDKQVRHCEECDEWESKVFDQSNPSDPYRWVSGNIWFKNKSVLILTGTYEEFQEAASKLFILHKDTGIQITRLESITQLENLDMIRPAIIVWGTWYDNPVVHDPSLAYYLNLQAG